MVTGIKEKYESPFFRRSINDRFIFGKSKVECEEF